MGITMWKGRDRSRQIHLPKCHSEFLKYDGGIDLGYKYSTAMLTQKSSIDFVLCICCLRERADVHGKTNTWLSHALRTYGTFRVLGHYSDTKAPTSTYIYRHGANEALGLPLGGADEYFHGLG